jgi:deoxyribodipyrimidine photo-lyase
MSPPVLLWFRRDLRLSDNAALRAAIATGSPVIPVFVWSPEEEAPWAPGAASRWWLHQSLGALDAELRKRGSRLIIRRGPVVEALQSLAGECGAAAVYWNRLYSLDHAVESALRGAGIATASFAGALLREPGDVMNTSGKPFQVFTPFYKRYLAMPPVAAPESAPRRIPAPAQFPASLELAALALEPRVDWAGRLRETWTPGEAGALARLSAFRKGAITDYATGRDRPDRPGTSRLSPHIHFGEISPRRLWHTGSPEFVRQVVWREFAHHLLFHFPQTPREPLRPTLGDFPTQFDAKAMRAWQRGLTGYPLVDAGMRELWHTGWMHNRVRMVVASFLVKHLMIPWQQGAAWFWDTLVDADLANDTFGWQWAAGCGADAAPYFRVFNPTLQAEKFDPDRAYIRRWVPEVDSPQYPRPIVDHREARRRFLER